MNRIINVVFREDFMTPKEVGKKLKISTRKVIELIETGQIEALKIGLEYRIKTEDFEAYLNSVKVSRQSYEEKFKVFTKICADAKERKIDVVIIHHPQVLGDTYIEIVESLNRLAAAELQLLIVPPGERDKK